MSTYAKVGAEQRYTQAEQAAVITADGGAVASRQNTAVVTRVATTTGFNLHYFPAAGQGGEAVVHDS